LLKINAEKLTRIIITTLVSCVLISCENFTSSESEDEFADLTFDMRLTQDTNGYYHLTLDRNNWQTLHRVSGSIVKDGYGVENFRVEWESDLYWIIGDTLGYIVSRGLNMNLQYVNYDTTYLTQFSGLEVSTTNIVSLSNSSGEFNNMIAPVRSMIGDTMRLKADWYEDYTTFSIVLN
jgi:hypothetical protein